MEFIAIQTFNIPKPASLPFYLLVWGQVQVFKNNCMYNGRTRKQTTPLCMNFNGVDIAKISTTDAFRFDPPRKITHVYYTESDQIVNFNSFDTLHAIANASDAETLFAGFRHEKFALGEATQYNKDLHPTRGSCGREGFFLDWPNSTSVKSRNQSESAPGFYPHKKTSGATTAQKKVIARTKLRHSSIAELQMKNTVERVNKAATTRNAPSAIAAAVTHQ